MFSVHLCCSSVFVCLHVWETCVHVCLSDSSRKHTSLLFCFSFFHWILRLASILINHFSLRILLRLKLHVGHHVLLALLVYSGVLNLGTHSCEWNTLNTELLSKSKYSISICIKQFINRKVFLPSDLSCMSY